MSQPRQPFLHDLVTTLAAPTQVLSDRSGQIGVDGSAAGAQGVLHADVRVLSALQLSVDDVAPEHIATRLVPATSAGDGVVFSYVLRQLAVDLPGQPDPQLRLDRERRVQPGRLSETLTVTSVFPQAVSLRLAVTMAYDLAPIAVIKVGDSAPTQHSRRSPRRSGRAGYRISSRSICTPAEPTSQSAPTITSWRRAGPSRSRPAAALGWPGISTSLTGAAWCSPPRPRRWTPSGWLGIWPPERTDPAKARTIGSEPGWSARWPISTACGWPPAAPEDTFFAAGSPWYLTLFGRDSLWAARMMLRSTSAYAMGTLRTLAGLAGTSWTSNTAEEPGKIPHELRRDRFTLGAWRFPRSTTAPSTPPCCGSACCTTPGAPEPRTRRSQLCCRLSRRRCAG